MCECVIACAPMLFRATGSGRIGFGLGQARHLVGDIAARSLELQVQQNAFALTHV